MANLKKREADFSVRFRHWIRANPPTVNCTFEIKQTTTNSIPFSCLEEQQIDYADALRNGKKGVLVRHQGMNGEPDYLYLYHVPTFVVVKFPKCFCIIRTMDFVKESKLSKRKSLTVERARDIAMNVVKL